MPTLPVRSPLLGLLLLTALLAGSGCAAPAPQALETAEEAENAEALAAAEGVFFCFWNVENLFDDRDDKRPVADEPYDNWFARDKKALEHKLDNLCKPLLKMNNGRGPDILALCEVESVRAVELLRDALNQRLPQTAPRYQHILMKELTAGRHIAPAILTRLPVKADRTKLLGKRQRILEGHMHVNGHELVVIASHWTSRLSDEDGNARGRYADQIYGAFQAMHKSNPAVDLLICGDFNDPPSADSLTKHLHASGSPKKNAAPPQLLNLMAKLDHNTSGTHYFRGWWIFDQIVVSPGLVDQVGWSCEPNSVRVDNSLFRTGDKLRRPWRFGSEDDKGPRGYSDHFPVTVRLKVQG